MSDLNVPLLVLVGAAIGYIAAGGQGWPTDQSATLAVRRTHREKRILFVFGLFFDAFPYYIRYTCMSNDIGNDIGGSALLSVATPS